MTLLTEAFFLCKDDPTEEVELTQCTTGGYFGELALVTHKPRAASVYAVGDLVCAGKECVNFVDTNWSPPP